jgi:hypothetical protein
VQLLKQLLPNDVTKFGIASDVICEQPEKQLVPNDVTKFGI